MRSITPLLTFVQTLVVLWLSVFLAACNYHLRGESEVPEVMRHIYLQAASPQLYSSFKETLHLAGGNLSDKPDPHGVTLNIVNERFDRRILSLSDTGKSNEFQLFYVLDFEILTFDNKMVLPSQRVQVSRDYFNNQQDIIGKNNEENLIRIEMYRQAVRSIMDRGQALMKQAEKK
jgi:LPS-assembly lipoprotein